MDRNSAFEALHSRYLANELSEEELELFLSQVQQGEQEKRLALLMEDAWQQMYGQEEGTETRVRSMHIRSIWKIAAAAVLILAASGIYFLAYRLKSSTTTVAGKPVTIDVKAPTSTKAMITLADGRQIELETAGTGTLATQNGVKVIRNEKGEIIYEQGVYSHTGGRGSGTKPGASVTPLTYNTFFNPRGSKAVAFTLSDGTKAWFNSESSLKYPVVFNGNTREVEVTGEVYFEVAHDPSKPFQVKNGSTTVTVLGTHFNVKAYNNDVVRVTLLEGSVKLSSGASAVTIRPGEQAIVTGNRQLTVDSNSDLEEVMAWKNGRFQFVDADITDILKEISRYYDVSIVNQDQVSGRFVVDISRDVPVSKLLQTLELTDRMHFTIEGKTITIMK